jgi:DNA-directed RNA polymerase subunit M/transcription elongation factor TFIIS
MKQKPTCPDCIEPLEPITKHFGPNGGKRIYLQCPKCGYNIRKSSIIYYENREIAEFDKRKEETNCKWENL